MDEATGGESIQTDKPKRNQQMDNQDGPERNTPVGNQFYPQYRRGITRPNPSPYNQPLNRESQRPPYGQHRQNQAPYRPGQNNQQQDRTYANAVRNDNYIRPGDPQNRPNDMNNQDSYSTEQRRDRNSDAFSTNRQQTQNTRDRNTQQGTSSSENYFLNRRPTPPDTDITTSDKRSVHNINISKRKLSQKEISVLEKGLKFCPTPQEANSEELKKDRFQFIKRKRLAEYFHGSEQRQNKSLVKNKSDFTSNKSYDQPSQT